MLQKTNKKTSIEYSTSVINIYHEASSKILLVNEPQEHEHSSDVISIYQEYLS